jgi:hypothetical protein
MDSELSARISPSHRRRLAWLEEHQGEVSPFPGPLPPTNLLLVSKPKGWDLQTREPGVRAQHQDQPGQPLR